MDDATPLTALLSWVWVAWTIEADNAFEAVSAERLGGRFRISWTFWANGLRLIDDDGITVDELAGRAGGACNIPGLERWGWIKLGDREGARRDGFGTQRGIRGDTLLRPTRAGAYARRAWPRVIDAVARGWDARFGADAIAALRTALDRYVAPGPWAPPQIAPSDGFRTTVTGGEPLAADAPLLTRLAHALVELTVEYERASDESLPLAANVLRVAGPDGVAVRDVPARAGVSKEAATMTVNYVQRRGLATTGDRLLTLTPRGLAALDGFRERTSAMRDDALGAALLEVLMQTDALRAGMKPPVGCWRGAAPYLAQTERMLADPTASLPWQPMVLHRGGWPDGS